MQLNTKLRILEHADHLSHKITLILVAASLAALLLGNLFPEARQAETALNVILHFVHWFALAVVVLYLLARQFLERNVGRELARLIKNSETHEDAGSAQGKPKPATRSGALLITAKDVEFVASSSGQFATLLNDRNLEGFERSLAFGMTREEVIQRNSAIIDRCPTAFQLVRAGPASPRDVFIGYTCVLPLNEVGTDVYLRGLIKDKDIPASLLCRPGETAKAILVFAIVLDQRITKSKSLKGKSFGFLLRALEYHVSVIAQEYSSGSGAIDVWVQSEDDSLRTLLLSRGFKSSTPKIMSANGHELLRLEFQPPPAETEVAANAQSPGNAVDAPQEQGKEQKQDVPVEKALPDDRH